MAQTFQQDPDALATMLRGQPQIPRYTDEEYDLQSMIPEEQLYQAQEAQSDMGRARGGPYSVSSRDSLRDSGMAELRKMFGIQQAKGQAAAYPNQVAGQFNLQREGIRAQGNVEAARVKAEAEATQRGDDQTFRRSMQEQDQTFRAGQGELTRNALVGRATQAQGAAQQGREYTQGQINDRAEAKKPFSLLGSLGSLFGIGGETNTPPSNEASELAPLKQHPKYSQMSFADLVQQGIIQADSPEELAAYQQAWGQ